MAQQEFVIKLENISKVYRLFGTKTDRMKEALHPFKKKYHKEFYALNNISLEIAKGEILGIVGMNGSGKSTMLKIIAGIIQPTAGVVSVKGKVVPLLELGAGFNPEFSGLENIYFYNSILGYSRRETDAMLDKILDFAEIGDFIDQPFKNYSSGMKARLSFAVSVNIDPDILIVDEILSVGDELFRRKSFARIEEFFNAGKTILFVSHSIQGVNQLCSRAIMIQNGEIVLDGIPKVITRNYQKFIFSSQDQKSRILTEFKTFGPDTSIEDESDHKENSLDLDNSVPKVVIETTEHTSYLIDNFQPQSTAVTRNCNISITHFRIETSDGREVNHIVPEKEYIITYKISFLEDIGYINLGIGITNEKGVSATWRIFPSGNSYFPKYYTSGESIWAHWRFSCYLTQGTYFLNITIRRKNEIESMIAYRASDIHVFKVLGDKKNDIGGVFDAHFSLNLEQSE